MNNHTPLPLLFSPEVSRARAARLPLVALESTVITHGLPYPQNLQIACEMEAEVRRLGAVPATIAMIAGQLCVGLNEEQLENLARGTSVQKLSPRDLAIASLRKQDGGTTVAGTIFIAHHAGIKVFATGGIGGVHRYPPYDISADLMQLANTPIVVVCAGAKAILDLPGTLELLETLGVPVIGYRTDEFPAFYCRSSGLALKTRMDAPEEVARLAEVHWGLGLRSAILVVTPPPEEVALPETIIQKAVSQAVEEAHELGVRGQEMTPFLLRRVSELTGGESLKANLALLRNNARLAARIAMEMSH
jgi:pseudouridine-5'-phosphate glycosidase